MKKNRLHVCGTALLIASTLALWGCGFAAKNLAKQVSDLTKQAAKIEKQAAELQVKAADIEEKAASLSARNRRTYQEELARLGFEAPEWLFSDAEALSSGAPEEDVDIPGGILGGLARIIRAIGGDSGGGGSDGGTFTLTGIPSQYNGKYAMAMGGDMGKDIAIVGAQTYTRNPVSITLVPIRNGRVTLNLWATDSFRQSPYTGNDALSVLVYISDQATGEDINEGEHTIGFNEVSFKNGGATKAWRDGIVGLVSSSTDGGTFTLTGIPAQYNGKYATLMGEDSRKNMALMGAQAITWPTGGEPTTALAPIRGGRAAINLWTPTSAGLSPYKGNDTLKVSVGIFDQAVAGPGESPMEEYTVEFANVSFRNGSATQDWRAGTVEDRSSSRGDSSWKWTSVADSPLDDYYINAIAYGNNRFVTGDVRGRMAYSSDGGANAVGESWTAVSDSTFGTSGINAIAYGNSRFVAVGGEAMGGGGKMAYSDDGIIWTAVSNSTFSTSNIYGIAYGNSRFVAVGDEGKMAYSTDGGANWTAVSDSTFGSSYIRAIAYGNNRFVAGGQYGDMAYSDDGRSWTAVADSTFPERGRFYIYGIAYGNNRFVAVGDEGKMAYSTDNGANWTAVSDSTFGDSRIHAIAYGNNRFLAGGDDGKMAYSTNGQSWTKVADSALGGSITAIAYANGRFVAEGGGIAYADW